MRGDPELDRTLERRLLVALVIAGVAFRLFRLHVLSFGNDEETTTLAALALLEGWPPTLPGGLVYVRALLFTALEAGSVAIFGVSEWSLRLAPALLAAPRLFGIWWLARPLLGGRLALAACAILALAPLDVELSRTARMYSLFATFDVLFLACVVRALTSARGFVLGSGFGALATFTHVLGGAHAPAAWAGALGRGLSVRVRAGLAAMGGVVAVTYLVTDRISADSYRAVGAGPRLPGVDAGGRGDTPLESHLETLRLPLESALEGALVAVAVIATLALGVWGVRRLEEPLARLAAIAMALAFCAASPVAGAALALSVPLLEGVGFPALLRRAPQLVAAATVATAGWAVALFPGLGAEGAVRALLDYPAPNWADFALAAPAFVVLAVGGMLLVPGRAAREGSGALWLVLAVAALAPLLATGLLERREGLRYQIHAVAPLIVFALAGVETLLARRGRRLALFAAVVLSLVAVRPDQAVRAVLRDHGPVAEPFAIQNVAPDHRGAAGFVRAHAEPNEWIAAEDVLQQRLYLGRSDVWLRIAADVGPFVRRDRETGEVRDIYTGALLANDLDALATLARENERPVVWLITSGETEASPEYYRTKATDRTLADWRPLAWFVGADGMTRVYKLVDGEPAPRPGNPSRAR